jgi:CO dehydrogenase maturation factor
MLKRDRIKIAVSGKGGSGKTTIAGTLARVLAKNELPVLAVDGDSNPNLAITLGIPKEEIFKIEPVPRTVLVDVVDADGKKVTALSLSPDQIIEKYGVKARDGVMLLLMGRVDHAGAG